MRQAAHPWVMVMIRKTIPLIFPDDLDQSARFYTDILGFVEAGREEGFVELRSGGLTLWLHSDEDIDDASYKEELHEHKRGVGLNLSFEVDDLQKYYERIVEKGDAPVEQEMESTPWGTRRFTVQDPNGYHLSFFSYE